MVFVLKFTDDSLELLGLSLLSLQTYFKMIICLHDKLTPVFPFRGFFSQLRVVNGDGRHI